MLQFLATVLIIAGIGGLGASLLLSHNLIATLPPGGLRNQWLAMTALIGLFVVGYAIYLFVFLELHNEAVGLIVPCVFFLGGCFVWLATRLALHTAEGVRRIALLEIESTTDPLTKLHNRRYLDRRLEEEVTRAKRYSAPLSVMLLDIDHFKSVNDRFGHKVGDLLLVQLAETLMEAMRDTDFAARYGGEEFLVVATHTALADAASLAERLRAQVAASKFMLATGSDGPLCVEVTVSIGVANLDERTDDAGSVVQEADRCLYRAKRLGRNRVATTATSPEYTVVSAA